MTTGVNQSFGLAFDSRGNLYVAYYNTHVIHEFSPTGADLGNFATKDNSVFPPSPFAPEVLVIVPEPASIVLVIFGVIALLALARWPRASCPFRRQESKDSGGPPIKSVARIIDAKRQRYPSRQTRASRGEVSRAASVARQPSPRDPCNGGPAGLLRRPVATLETSGFCCVVTGDSIRSM